jgi:gliding motility-associated-like protein
VVAGTNVNGGANGTVTGSTTSKVKTKFPPNGATGGGVGSNTTAIAPFYLTANNDTVCPSSAASLSVTVNGTTPSGLAINWYTVATGGTPVSNSNPYNITSPATAGTYTYYAGTCPGMYRIPVILVVNSSSPPTLTVSATNTMVCSGSSVTLTVSGATSYTWDANAGNATTNTVSVNPSSNTTYSVTGATLGACAGTGTASININVIAAPTITITPTSYSLCSGVNDTLTASGATSYTWSSNASSATTASVIITPTVGATTYSVTGSNGTCASTQSVAINVTATPTVSISPANAYICKGTSTSFTASGANTYSWSTTATSTVVSVSPTSNTTYTVTGYNGTCSDTKTVLVKVDNGITKADSVSNSTSCGQSNGSYVLNSITGGISPYQINFNGTGFSAIASFADTVKNLGANSYPIIIKDSLGCTYATSVTIGNTGGPTTASISAAPDTCSRNVGALNVVSVTGGTTPYMYSINGTTYQASTSFTGLAPGTYTVFVKDNNGCTISLSNNTIGSTGVATTPTITASGNTTFCQGGSVTLSSSSASSYTWSTGSTAQTITVSTSGVYTVETTSPSGCTAMDTITITVKNNPPTPVVNDTTITECQNSVHIISFNHSTGSTLIIHNASGQIQPIPFKPTTVGTTTYTAYDSLNGCVSTVKNITVNINPAPTTAATVTTPVTYCYGQVTDTLQALPTVNGGYIVWEDANHNVLTTPPAPSPSSTILGVTTYYVYQGVGACPGLLYDSIQVIILNKPSPNFTINPSTDIYVGQPISFTPIQTTTANTYYWNFDDAASTSNTSHIPLPNHTYNNGGSYCPKLIVTNSLGCKDSTTLCLDVLTTISLTIPNVFSPNGDGINDYFSVKSTGITDLSCDIFDRWGLKLYSWNGVTGFWDGTEKSGKATDGTYYYVIQTTDVKGVSQTNKGFIELIR